MEKRARPDERFLSRWSRRKATVAEAESTVAESAPVDSAGEVVVVDDGVGDGAGEKRAPVLTDADMPPLESLSAESDFSGFLSPGVSEALRRRALRKLFSAAVFNHRDGLDDYDDDFRHFAALGEHITSDMKHRMEMEAERAKAEAAEETAGEADGDVDAADGDVAHGDVDAAHDDDGEGVGDGDAAHADGDSPSTESMGSPSPPSPPSPADSPSPTR